MATTEQTAATKAELDASIALVGEYVDTAVDTLTAEMDRQFKEVRGDIKEFRSDIDKRFDEVLKAIREHSHA